MNSDIDHDPPVSPVDEFRRAGTHINHAADAAVEALMPREVRHHLRSAVRHLLRAGVAAIDHLDRRTAPRTAEGCATPGSRSDEPVAGSHTPDTL